MNFEAHCIGGPLAGNVYAMPPEGVKGEPALGIRIESASTLRPEKAADDTPIPIKQGVYARDKKPFKKGAYEYVWQGWKPLTEEEA